MQPEHALTDRYDQQYFKGSIQQRTAIHADTNALKVQKYGTVFF
jgi:hypothetical protein